MTTFSRNQAVNKLIEEDGEEETKRYVKQEYNIPDSVHSWKDIDDIAERMQIERNAEHKAK